MTTYLMIGDKAPFFVSLSIGFSVVRARGEGAEEKKNERKTSRLNFSEQKKENNIIYRSPSASR